MSDSDRMMTQIGNCLPCGSMHITVPAISQYIFLADNGLAITGSGRIFKAVFCKCLQTTTFMLFTCTGFNRDPGNLQPVLHA